MALGERARERRRGLRGRADEHVARADRATAPRARAGAAAALVAAAIGIAVWLPSGPLAKGWAAKAGTPASLIGGKHTTTARRTRQ